MNSSPLQALQHRMFEVRNITVSAGSETRVSNVHLRMSPGDVHVLLGPNGSGKSTLVKALMGHPSVHIEAGDIELHGEDVHTLSVTQRARRGLYLSPQHVPKLPGVKLVTFLHKAHEALRQERIDILELYSALLDAARMLNIDETLIDRELSSGLSGGEQKQVECLQLAVLRPRVAFVDELDSGVDVDRLTSIFTAVRTLREQGTAFLLVSHHPSLLAHLTPTRVHIMREGALVQSGDADLAAQVLAHGFGPHAT